MRALWRYLQAKDNREVLAYLCGGLAAVVSAGWVVYTHVADKPAASASVTTVSAPGGVAAQSITNSPITVGPQPRAGTVPDTPK